MSYSQRTAGAVARAHHKPRREKMFGEGRTAAARPQRQGPHHGAGPRADASNGGGEALRRADREVRGGARRAAVGLPQRRERPVLPELRTHRGASRLRAREPSTRRSTRWSAPASSPG